MRKALSVNLGKIEGLTKPEDDFFSQVFIEEPEKKEVLQLRGKLFGIASLSSKQNLELEDIFKKTLKTFRKEYYQNTKDNVLRALEGAILSAQEQIQNLIKEKGVLVEKVDFNLIAAVLWGNVLYIGQLGDSKAMLLREAGLRTIGKEEGEEREDVLPQHSVRMASGLIREKDFLVLGTLNFFKNFSSEKIESYLLSYPLEQAVKLIKEAAHKQREKSLISALVLNFEVKIFPTEEEAISIVLPREESERRFGPFSFLKGLKGKLKKEKLSQIESLAQNMPEKDMTIKSEDWLSSSKKKASLLLDQASEKIKVLEEIRGKSKQESPEVFLKKSDLGGKSKKWLLLAFGLVVVLFISVWLTLQVRNSSLKRQELESIVSQVKENLSEAERISLSEQEKKNKLEEAKKLLEQTKNLDIGEDELSEAKELSKKVNELLYNIFSVSERRVVADLVSYDQQANPRSITENEEYFYSLDQEKPILYQVSKGDGKIEGFSFNEEEMGNPQLLVANKNGVYLFDHEKGITEFSFQTETFSLVIEADSSWQQIKDLGTYYRNLYLLDSQAGQVHKYVPISSGFTERLDFIVESTGEEFQKAASLAIDGTVYVLTDDGQMLQYVAGRKKDFSLQNLPESLQGSFLIRTEEDFDYLYILDVGLKSIVVLDKEGVYQKEYRNENWSDLKGLWVEENEGSFFVLEGTRILEVSLK